MSHQSIIRRELLLQASGFAERNSLPGAWRLRRGLENLHFQLPPGVKLRCSTLHGVDIVIEPDVSQGIEREIFLSGTYEPGTLGVMAAVLPVGGRFMDIGANVGLMSLYAGHLVGPIGHVDSFEPLPEIRDLLAESITLNRLENITIHPFALGSSISTARLHRHPEVNRGSASLAWASADNDTIDVEIGTIDNFLSGTPNQCIDMIKIDVEGWELEVLRGGKSMFSSSHPPVVCVEVSALHPLHGGSPLDIFDLMAANNYKAYVLRDGKGWASSLRPCGAGEIPVHDNVFFFHVSCPFSLESGLPVRR